MRILHIHSGNLYGGVETVLRTMARCRALAPQMEPVFALSFEGRIAEELRAAGCEVHVLGEVHASQPLSILRTRARLTALCRTGCFDASVVHSPWAVALLAPAATRPLVYFQHDLLNGRHWTELWSYRTRPDLVISNSDFVAETSPALFKRLAAVTIHPPIELSTRSGSTRESQALRRRFGTPDQSVVILHAGRFEGWKGHHLLLNALGQLRDNKDWYLWLAGAPQRSFEQALRRELDERVRTLGISDRVAFTGHTSDMNGLMRAADIYCQPNTRPEPFGLTFVEAMHAELAVLSTALGGAKEILSPDWGVLTEPSPEAVAEGLRALITDVPLRTRFGEAGPFRARTLCDPHIQLSAFARAIGSIRQRQEAA